MLVTNFALITLNQGRTTSEEFLHKFKLQGHPRISWLQGQLFYRSGDSTSAITYWQRNINWSTRMLVSMAMYSSHKGRNQAVIEQAKLALLLQPQNADAALLAARVLRSQRLWQKAIPYWEIVVNAHPDDPDILAIYGEVLAQNGDIRQARQQLQRAVDLAPERWLPNQLYLQFLADHGQGDEYKQLLLHAKTTFPEAIVINRWLGELAFKENAYDEAARYFKFVLQERPDWVKVAEQLEAVYQETDRLETAAVMYRELLGLRPNQTEYHIGLLRALHKLGDHEAMSAHACLIQKDFPQILSDVQETLQPITIQCPDR